jgi:hypothetical protein
LAVGAAPAAASAPGAATRRAVDSSTVASSRSPFILSVEPVEVRSTITSAMPRCGAISTAPEMGAISTVRPASAK